MKPVLTVYKVFLSLSLAFQSDDGTHFHADKKYCLEIYFLAFFFDISAGIYEQTVGQQGA